MRLCLATLYGILLAASVMHAQQPKVVVVNSDSKDLKRTAYRLRIPAERLKNARQALQEATDLARRVRLLDPGSSSQLGNFWVMLYRTKAKASIDGLVSSLKTTALETREANEYILATLAVGPLLAALAQVDQEEALQQAKRWPEPSESLGEAAQKSQSEMEKQFRLEAARRIARRDPEAALKLWSGVGGTDQVDFSLRAWIAESMVRAGRKDDAVKLMDQTVSDLASADVSQIEPSDLTDLTQTLVRVVPNRFPEAFRLMVTSSANMPAGGAPSVKIGNEVVFLDNSEAVALNLLKDIQQRPTLVTELMDTLPELKSKLEPVGGIDGILSGGPVELSYGSQGALEKTTFYGPEASYGDQLLYAQLHGADSETVREKLSGLAASPSQIYDLFNLAVSVAVEDPDLSSGALEQARKLIARIEPLSARVPLFAQLLRVSRRCDGEVDPELYKQGIALVTDIRDEEANQVKQGGRSSPSASSGADMLERTLISELAVDDFEAAVKYTKKIPEERLRLSVLLAIVEACRRPF
jgi:hypothetical protein